MGFVIFFRGKKSPGRHVYQTTIDIFYQKSFTEIEKEGSKLRTYKLVNNEIREEPYLAKVRNIKDRLSLTKFPLSNHKLMIEKGRPFKMEKSARKCPFCSVFEDEIHFLLNCKTFLALRRELNLENLIGMNDKKILKLPMRNLDIAPIIARYLTRTMYGT